MNAIAVQHSYSLIKNNFVGDVRCNTDVRYNISVISTQDIDTHTHTHTHDKYWKQKKKITPRTSWLMRKPERHSAVGLGWEGGRGAGKGITGKESHMYKNTRCDRDWDASSELVVCINIRYSQ